MRQGRIVERGLAEAVLEQPSDAYTRQLLRDTPTLRAARAEQQVAS